MTLPAPAPLSSGGGGGGGGLTAEADTIVMRDDGDGSYFLRHLVRNDVGTVTSTSDTELDGTTAKGALVGAAVAVWDVAAFPNGGAPVITRVNQAAANTPFATAAGRSAVTVIVLADGATVGGVAWPAVLGHTFWDPARRQASITVEATDGTGDVLVIEEAA